jgi:hypothetical protein
MVGASGFRRSWKVKKRRDGGEVMAEINTVLTIDTEAARETLKSLVREARAEARADLEQTLMSLIDRVEALEDAVVVGDTPLMAVRDTTRFVQVRDDLWVNPALVAYVMADGSGTYVKVVNGGAPTPWAIGDVLRALGVEG